MHFLLCMFCAWITPTSMHSAAQLPHYQPKLIDLQIQARQHAHEKISKITTIAQLEEATDLYRYKIQKKFSDPLQQSQVITAFKQILFDAKILSFIKQAEQVATTFPIPKTEQQKHDLVFLFLYTHNISQSNPEYQDVQDAFKRKLTFRQQIFERNNAPDYHSWIIKLVQHYAQDFINKKRASCQKNNNEELTDLKPLKSNSIQDLFSEISSILNAHPIPVALNKITEKLHHFIRQKE